MAGRRSGRFYFPRNVNCNSGLVLGLIKRQKTD
jgi:hypothetical protein